MHDLLDLYNLNDLLDLNDLLIFHESVSELVTDEVLTRVANAYKNSEIIGVS